MLKCIDGRPEQTGGIAWDFGLPIRSSRTVLSVVGRRSALPAGLFPETQLVSRRHPADAVLLLSTFSARSLPTLRASPGFLRLQPHGPATLYSATLAREFEASSMSWPAAIMADDGWYTPSLARRAEIVLERIRSGRIGSAWWLPAARQRPRRAVVFAAAGFDATLGLLEAALARFGAGETTLVCPRHRRLAGAAGRLGVAVVTQPVNPWGLIEAADCVFAPETSEAALLAEVLGRELGHRGSLAPAQLLAATLLLGTRYVDPFTKRPIDCEQFLDIVAELGRRCRNVTCLAGISFWKRARVAAMIGGRDRPAFRRTARAALAVASRRGGAVAVWASRAPGDLKARADAAGVPLMQLEDGFVRSVGIGAEFRPPLSLVLDRLGLYYDPTGPSDLEQLLSETVFPPALLARAALLRDRMVRERVTKYNLPSSAPIDRPRTGRVILVPGQVADDRSVRLGGGGVGAGLDLLRRVRHQAPDAYVIYKPHPDVDAGHRLGAVPDAEVLEFADRIIRGGSMADLLAIVDAVHTLTSLTGFEALLRGKPVTCYGQPFYAGWGLTTDLNPPERRTRRLQLDELVAGVLILYPSYIDPVTLLACGPEIVLDRLRDPALHRPTLLIRARRAQGRLSGHVHRWWSYRHDRSQAA